MRLLFMIKTIALLLICWWPAISWCAEYVATPENYRPFLKRLAPGDTLRLQPGVYRKGLPVHNLSGLPGKPVVITANNELVPPVFLARSRHNTVSIVNSSYITIRNLVLDGQGLPVDGVKAEGHARWAHHITLENLLIRNHGHNQQTVGISTKCPAWNWEVRGNIIIGAGTGMYFGNSDGSDAFVAGLIERNLIVHTIGYNLQIKHQRRREDVPGMPQDDRSTTIRHNVFSKLRGGSAGPMARPNVLVGHWPLTGPGEEDQYLIYGNFFYQNPNEALFQGEGNLAFYNNLLVNDFADAVHIQPHNDVPRRTSIFFNTVITPQAGIVVRRRKEKSSPPVTEYSQWVVANAVFAATPILAADRQGNLTASAAQAQQHLRNPTAQPGELDLRPLMAMTSEFEAGRLQGFPDAHLDFSGTERKPGELGAYAYQPAQQTAAFWFPRIERKPLR